VKIVMTGEFVPLKDDGASGNAQAYGCKKETRHARRRGALGGRRQDPNEWAQEGR